MTQTHLQSNYGENSSVPVSPTATREEPQEQEPSQTVSDPPTEQTAEWEALLALLQQEQKQRLQLRRRIARFYWVSILFVIGIGLAQGHIWDKLFQYLGPIYFILYAIVGFGPIRGLLPLFLSKKAARKLAQLEDIRCVGPLVSIWGQDTWAQSNLGPSNYDGHTHWLAERALIRLLPRLKASDAALLNEVQRTFLRNALAMNGYIAFGNYHDTDFLIAILKAFEQIGDWRCEPLVREMAETAKDARVRKAAQDCLPYLEALAAKERVGEDLLRSSDMPVGGSEVLLRPATGSTETAPQQLLHPVDNTTD